MTDLEEEDGSGGSHMYSSSHSSEQKTRKPISKWMRITFGSLVLAFLFIISMVAYMNAGINYETLQAVSPQKRQKASGSSYPMASEFSGLPLRQQTDY
jgi:hypothetical protein